MSGVGILLAAGRGRRFDPSGQHDKLLQTLSDETGDMVVVASARILLSVLPTVVAVVRPGAPRVGAALQALGCAVTVCPDADSGMAASLVHAIRHSSDGAAWLVALGDMPHVQPGTLRALLAAIAAGADIAAPAYQGRRGNPVAFSRTHLPLLLALQGDEGARSILHTHPVCEVAVADSGILQDIDTRADLPAPE